MKKVLIVVLLVAVALSVAACGADNPVVGTWKMSDVNVAVFAMYTGVDAASEFGNMTYEFTKDGKVITKSGDITSESEYTIDGDKVTVTADGSDIEMALEGDSLYINGEVFLVRV